MKIELPHVIITLDTREATALRNLLNSSVLVIAADPTGCKDFTDADEDAIGPLWQLLNDHLEG